MKINTLREEEINLKKTKKVKKDGFINEIKRNKAFYLMMIPGLVFMLIFYYAPMVGVVIAFQDFNPVKGIFGSKFIGFTNFKYLFSSDIIREATFNTVFYNLIFLVTGIGLALLVAILLSELSNKYLSKTYKSIILFPYLLSWVVGEYLLYSFLSLDKGIVNNFLVSIGHEAIQWYSEPSYWRWIIPMAYIWKNIGYLSVIFLAGITGISPEYYEAARIDGATKWQQAIKITIPILAPITIILVLLQIGKIFSASFGDWGLFYNLPRESGTLFPATNVIDSAVFRALRGMADYGMASAAGLYQSVVGFVLIIISNFVIRKYDKESALF